MTLAAIFEVCLLVLCLSAGSAIPGLFASVLQQDTAPAPTPPDHTSPLANSPVDAKSNPQTQSDQAPAQVTPSQAAENPKSPPSTPPAANNKPAVPAANKKKKPRPKRPAVAHTPSTPPK